MVVLASADGNDVEGIARLVETSPDFLMRDSRDPTLDR